MQCKLHITKGWFCTQEKPEVETGDIELMPASLDYQTGATLGRVFKIPITEFDYPPITVQIHLRKPKSEMGWRSWFLNRVNLTCTLVLE